jgi:hypothetical protein
VPREPRPDDVPFWLSPRPFQEPVYPDDAWTDITDDAE